MTVAFAGVTNADQYDLSDEESLNGDDDDDD
eukprot:CAMPEP_0197048964 /NCGR_PEP_ID=MMETSP1384-20130603/24218_1 /TAXON_ID=29189 /ORGANISM="Ammonia sp." /LENGTH=30 /DNA_ID= /DNA_START= /DNA_END= /DNA_ORIENTATION=